MATAKRMRMNTKISDFVTCEKPCVYRYIDTSDNKIKYVGIVYKRNLAKRLQDHMYQDDWCRKSNWIIEYFECENKSEAEAFESHLISLYGSNNYFNKSKSNWGINRFLPDVESWWKPANVYGFENYETLQASILFRTLLRNGEIEKAKEMLNLFEFSNEGVK